MLVERAGPKRRIKQGGGFDRVPLEELTIQAKSSPLDLLALDEALAKESPEKAEVVQLRYVAGLKHAELADLLGVSTSLRERATLAAMFSHNLRLHGFMRRLGKAGITLFRDFFGLGPQHPSKHADHSVKTLASTRLAAGKGA